MVWGGVSQHHRTELVVIAGNLNAVRYREDNPPRNVQELAGALEEEWGNISQHKLANLVQSMRSCAAVLNASGGHTRY